MTIVVECPHCESRYNLQPDLLGKAMRCPNPDCREVFTVQEAAARAVTPPPEPEPEPTLADIAPTLPPAQPRSDAPPPAFVSGTVGDLVPVVEVEAEPTRTYHAAGPYERIEADANPVVPVIEGEAAGTAPPPVARTKPALPTAALVVDAEPAGLDDAPRIASSAKRPKEVVWSAAAGPPAPPAPPAAHNAEAIPATAPFDEDDDEILRRRRQRKALPIGILMGLIATIFALLIGIGVYLLVHEMRLEGRMAEDADEAFKSADYPKASSLYDELLARFPSSENRDRYEFFNDLSTLHTQVGALTFRENPSAQTYLAFLEKYGDSPLAQPDEGGFGHDIFEAGRKALDGIIEHAKDRLGKFRADRSQLDELSAAEQIVAQATQLLPTVERYRIRDIEPLTEQQQTLGELSAAFNRERHRLAVLAPWRNLADDPTDQSIAEFTAILKQNDLEKDREALQIAEAAKANLRRRIATVVRAVPPVPAPTEGDHRLIFVAPPAGERINPATLPAADVLPETFFAVARGNLYAVDADTGATLWAVRVGQGRGVEDLPVRVPLGEGGTELVLIPTDLGGQPAITARSARTGEPYWHQPLEAPCAARPVVVGKRVYVPLLDDAGTVVEIEATAGNRLAHVTLRQRLGGGMVHQAGTGLVYVAAEGRRVFVLDTEPLNADGDREPMRCVQVLATDHPDQSLRTPPVLTGPAGDAPAPRFLIVAQADGTLETRVRAFALPPVSKTRTDETAGPPEIAPASAGFATLPGHVLFPPTCDGERLALVTDAGAFALYGTNQPGNQDPGLFPIPASALPTDPKQPSPGQVVYAEEDDFWVISRGNLIRLRFSLTALGGLQVASSGVPRPTGIPIHRPQVNSRRDTVLAVVRSDESDGVRAIAFDPRDGRIKWQRKLGAVPPVPPMPLDDGSALLIDEDGGVYHLPTTAVEAANAGTTPIEPAWIVAAPTLAAADLPRLAAHDGTIWVLIPERAGRGRTLRIRRIDAGRLVAEATVALPDRFAGSPVALGQTVVFPLADGFVYRYQPGRPELALGPQWRGEGVPADAACFLTAVGTDEFLSTDGGRRVSRWRWPTADAAEWRPVAGPWSARARITLAPALIPISETARRLLVADAAGNVWLFDADRAGEPLKRWRGSDGAAIPTGEPTGRFTLLPGTHPPRVLYAIDNRHLVCLAPPDDNPAWVVLAPDNEPDLLGWSVAGDTVLATNLAGRVTAYAASDGTTRGLARPGLANLFPQTNAVTFAHDRWLLPLWDGSAVFLTAGR